jgi:hypothetical protein
MTTVAIVQSCYIPWKGYFDLIQRADQFVLYDGVQYTSRDWRNRNRIKTFHGLQWLTIPVLATREQRISDVECADERWRNHHWRAIRHAYAKTPYFNQYAATLEELYHTPNTMLSDINQCFLEGICKLAGINTPMHLLKEHVVSHGDKTDKLIAVCKQYNATRYLSGSSAKTYLDITKFTDADIEVEWMNYDHYLEYPQLHSPFEHAVSMLDMLFNVGSAWKEYMGYL